MSSSFSQKSSGSVQSIGSQLLNQTHLLQMSDISRKKHLNRWENMHNSEAYLTIQYFWKYLPTVANSDTRIAISQYRPQILCPYILSRDGEYFDNI